MARPDTSLISVDDIIDAIEQDDNLGFCTACGDEAYNVEPDAERYRCESCGQHAVYGAQQLLLYVAA